MVFRRRLNGEFRARVSAAGGTFTFTITFNSQAQQAAHVPDVPSFDTLTTPVTHSCSPCIRLYLYRIRFA